jgi:hypothetical protein
MQDDRVRSDFKTTMKTLRFCLWSTPCTVSKAQIYAFAIADPVEARR